MVEPTKITPPTIEPPETPQDTQAQPPNLEDRVSSLENSLAETNGYLQRILGVLQKSREIVELGSPPSVRQKPPINPDAASKKPLTVTIIDDHEKYSFKPNEPGILAAKPVPAGESNKHSGPMEQSQRFPGEPSFNTEHTIGDRTPHSGQPHFIPRPKIELQSFDGDNPRGWIRKCEKFFSIFAIPEQNKLEIAAMYLVGRAETWFDGYTMQKTRLTWHEFVADICHRFSDKEQTDIIEEFNKLFQKTSVADYQDKFKELKPFMLQLNANLNEDYFVSSFISGLKEELKHKVKVHEPKSLADAYRKATLYEISMEIDSKKAKSSTFRPFSTQNPTTFQKQTSMPTIPPQKQITTSNAAKQTLQDYRRANNLCFRCGDKFSPTHQCKLKQFHMMEDTEATLEDILTEETNQNILQNENSTVSTEESLEISMNALTGNAGYSTIRIQGSLKGSPLNILVDSGSTHSFITPAWAKEGLELIHTNPLAITVANGEQLISTAKSKKLNWKMQGHSFEHDFRVLHMGGSDMVLGVDWMRIYSPITMDFKTMTLTFMRGNQQIVLQGGQKENSLMFISGKKMQKLANKEPEVLGEFFFLTADPIDTVTPHCCQLLLQEYTDIFEEPKQLPPPRTHDHAITLQPGAQPINLRPYRFPYHQKTEVEKRITELLAASIIQNSKSPFASPCLLVKKKDGTWRLCVDYRQLNGMTVKNKFPIPVVEDLLDELAGVSFYSKIDLRSGYWQIRIKEEDIPKTAFRTHHGHFEFKVMPFGLTNAPATFQSLMNEIFQAYLRKFVLVFFDDILIYSSTMEDHLNHLKTVLDILRAHQLFARKKKCFFAQKQIEYLGHIISANGVATDPSKIEAMARWQLPTTIKSLRGFLGLTRYYRKFIRGYGAISKPLTALLKKDSFKWNEEATQSFNLLKQAMCSAPVLALPDFTKPFQLETDATIELNLGKKKVEENDIVSNMKPGEGQSFRGSDPLDSSSR
ncbi:hypothetical protein GQ457_03G027370 [Hibiscus cannabinus]